MTVSKAGLPGSGVAILVLALSSGCTTRGGDIPYAPAGFVAPQPETQGELAQDLPLGPLDLLKVTVFRVPDLSGDYQVRADGLLDLPLLGAVDVRNLSPGAAATLLERRYGERYLNNPDITIRVVNSGQRNITLEGGVQDPGVYPISGRTTLLGAIALANGVDNERANPRRVAIFRKIDGKTAAAAFDLVDIRRGKMADPAVYPGDTIVIDSNSLRSIYKDVIQTLPAIAIFNAL